MAEEDFMKRRIGNNENNPLRIFFPADLFEAIKEFIENPQPVKVSLLTFDRPPSVRKLHIRDVYRIRQAVDKGDLGEGVVCSPQSARDPLGRHASRVC
jgi:hypothetical protein